MIKHLALAYSYIDTDLGCYNNESQYYLDLALFYDFGAFSDYSCYVKLTVL